MPDLKVIEGGLKAVPRDKLIFADAAVTDTRLMGVLGLRVHWKDPDAKEGEQDIFQFYYYDIEEIGLDSLNVYAINGTEGLDYLNKLNFGGLGAGFWPVTETEARYLICRFIEETKRKKQPLPDNVYEADFILKHPPVLTPEEVRALNLKMCTFIKTDYGAINYYLMRLFGKDPEGAELLVSANARPEDLEDVSLDTHATFLKNRIEPYTDETGTSYLCESMVDGVSSHWIVTSELKLSGGKITSCKKLSAFKISSAEASMKTTRGEYVTVFEILCEMDDFDKSFDIFTLGATRTDHETGELFMCFKEDNLHVEQPEFSLSDDIKTMYFVSDFGQLIVSAYSREDIWIAENLIMSTDLSDKLEITGRYNFVYGIIYDFATSGYTDFDAFVDDIKLN